MGDLRQRVHEVITRNRLLHRGDRVLVAVSGGPDSVALLHMLVGLKDALRLSLSIVHLDHQLRADSTGDAAFVEGLGRRLKVPVITVRRDVRTEAASRGWSLEDGARRIRYDVFDEVARGQRADRVALAHTADDQAETVLMRLLRGAGLTGLMGIPMRRPLVDGVVEVVRPLLEAWRWEILAYLDEHRLAFRDDETNRDLRFVRNRVRSQLLPLLERDYNPQIKALLTQLAEQCRTDEGFLQEVGQRMWRRVVRVREGALDMRIKGFRRQPPSVQRQLVRLAIHRLQGDLERFEFRHWREIARLFADRPVGTILDLPGALQLERTRELVVMRLAGSSAGGNGRPHSNRRLSGRQAEASPVGEAARMEPALAPYQFSAADGALHAERFDDPVRLPAPSAQENGTGLAPYQIG